MTILYDLQPVQCWAYRDRGIGRYTAELAKALDRLPVSATAGRDVGFVVNEGLGFHERIDELELGGPIVTWSEVDRAPIELLHTTGPMDPERADRRRVPVRPARHVVTCYDLIPYRWPSTYLGAARDRIRYTSRLGVLVAADAIVSDSDATARDLTELLDVDPRRITTVGGASDERFRPPTAPLVERIRELRRRLPSLRVGYVLAPTGWDPRKNNAGLVAAYARLDPAMRRRHQLVIVAADDEYHRSLVAGWCTDHGIEQGDVVVTGHVVDDDLIRLYQSAELVVFPSRSEGFGLPVLEARRCGARTVCGDNSSLVEVLLEPLARFDADDVEAIATTLRRGLTDRAFRRLLDDARFVDQPWASVARSVASVYDRVLRRLDGASTA